jgi:hypothetical protein
MTKGTGQSRFPNDSITKKDDTIKKSMWQHAADAE